jgi:hypothetical protein
MRHRLIKRNVQIIGTLRFPYDRRSGIERRSISYDGHIPERRNGKDRRVSGERRKDWIRTSQWSSTWNELYDAEWDLAE